MHSIDAENIGNSDWRFMRAQPFHSFWLSVSALLLCLQYVPVHADIQSIQITGEVAVFDGDTLEIGPMLIRLYGIDAPESGQRCASQKGETWRCGTVASKRLTEIISGKTLACDPKDRDPYGRIVARCFADGVDLGVTMVREGLAWAFVEYSEDYVLLEALARMDALNVWQALTQTPWEFRDDKWNRAVAAAPDGKCPIKGNISPGKNKLKIYHTPWSPNYTNTKIDAEKGEQWFCDEGEALAAGWSAQRSR